MVFSPFVVGGLYDSLSLSLKYKKLKELNSVILCTNYNVIFEKIT